MRDSSKKALLESRKTVSRKSRNKSALSTPKLGSVRNSAQTSRYASAATSVAGSDDEAHNVTGALSQLRISRTALSKRRRRRDSDDGDGSDDDESGNESDSGSSYSGDVTSMLAWKEAFENVLNVLQDRKRSNHEERVVALDDYSHLLRASYGGDALSGSLGLAEVSEQLVKSVQRGLPGEKQERQLALRSLALTVLSCPTPADTGLVFDDAFAVLKKLILDPQTTESDKAMAICALAVVVVCGSGIKSTLEGLLNFLLEIVESDGDSVMSLDSVLVVSAAIRAWSFAVSFVVDGVEEDDDGDDDDAAAADKLAHAHEEVYTEAERRSAKPFTETGSEDGDFLHGEDYLVSQSQRALDVFADQLESSETDVQIDAGNAIALLYEASRKYAAVLGTPLQLQRNPRQLAEEILEIGRGTSGSVKSVKRQARRQLRESFRSIATSLERSKGPNFSTATAPIGNGREGLDDVEENGYQLRLVVGDRVMTIDTWCKSVRVDMLRAVLGSGLAVHLVQNPLVRRMVDSSSLQKSAFILFREAEKARKVRKLARKTGGR